MASLKKSALKLPKLKIKDELLKTAPELARFLAEDPEMQQRAHSAYKRGTSAGRVASPSRLPFHDEEITEEEHLRTELEHVKQERANLMESIAKLRMEQGKSGGELQQEDIRILRSEIEAKKEKLNELAKETKRLMELLEQLELTSRECEQLMPQQMVDAEARVQQLTDELAGVENDIVEAEAKNELYKLLEIRTRRDHQAAEQQQRETRQLKEDGMDDYTTLTKHMHEMRAAKEDAERELAAVVDMFDQVRSDWQKKLKDRRKEVNEMEKRKSEDRRRQEQQLALQEENDRLERAKAAKMKQEMEVQEARASKVMPQLEALEVQWARLHAITGADKPDDVISHWTDLKQKEANMQELVKLAEVREARAKEEMSRLLEARAEVYHSSSPGPEQQEGQEADASNTSQTEMVMAEGSSHAYDEKAQAIADATRRKQTAKKKFNKLSHVCVAADQGLHLLLDRLCAAVSNAPLILAEAADRRASVGGARRQTRRISSVRRMSASAFMESRRTSLVGATMPAPRRETTTNYQPVGSTIHEAEFFPGLPKLLQEVGGRLDKVLELAAQLEAAGKGDALAHIGASTESSETALEGEPRRGTRTPRMQAGDEEDQLGNLPQNSEAALRKGFRRQTLAGPPWLEAVATKARTAGAGSPKKPITGNSTARAATALPNLQRIVGYAEDPESSDEDPFNLDSDSEDDAVLDRDMIKHHARKVLLAKQRKAGEGTPVPA